MTQYPLARPTPRRAFLVGVGGLAAAATAGCSSQGQGSGEQTSAPASWSSTSPAGQSSSSRPAGESVVIEKGWSATQGGLQYVPPAGKTAMLVGPSWRLTVNIAMVESLSLHNFFGKEVAGNVRTVLPEDAHQFLVVTVVPESNWALPQGAPLPQLRVHTPTGEIALEKLIGRPLVGGTYVAKQANLIAVVPTGGKLTMTLTEQGRTATMDLRAAKLNNDAETAAMTATVPTSRLMVTPAKSQWRGTWSDGTNTDTIQIGLDRADDCMLGRYYPGAGWAPKGRQWLVMRFRPSYRQRYNVDLPFDTKDAAWVSVGGKKYPSQPKKISPMKRWLIWVQIGPDSIISSVPEATTAGTFTLQPPTSAQIKYNNGSTATRRLRQQGALQATFKTKPR